MAGSAVHLERVRASAASSKHASSLRARAALLLSMHAQTIRNFRSPNMPWPGEQCISKFAGLSGAAYALPALVSPFGWECAVSIQSVDPQRLLSAPVADGVHCGAT